MLKSAKTSRSRTTLIALVAGLSMAAAAVVAPSACSPSQIATVHNVDTIAVDLTNAVCAVGEAQPAGQPWVDVVCTIAQATETGISVATATSQSDGGAVAASTIATTKTIHLHLSPADAQRLLAAHPPTTTVGAAK